MPVHIFPQISYVMQLNPCLRQVQPHLSQQTVGIYPKIHKPALYIQVYYPLDKNIGLLSFQDIRLIYVILHSDPVIQNPVLLFLLLTFLFSNLCIFHFFLLTFLADALKKNVMAYILHSMCVFYFLLQL